MIKRRFALALLILVLKTSFSFADCAIPAGVAGDIAYGSNNVMAYCNGASWVNMGSGASFGALTAGSFCTATSGTSLSCTTSAINLTSQVTGILPVVNGGTGTGTALTAGSVVFVKTSGIYNQDNSNFFWDSTNYRLGVGTNSPASKLQVAGGEIQPGNGGGSCSSSNAGAIRWNGDALSYCNGSSWLSFSLTRSDWDVIAEDQKPSGTSAGASRVGIQTRVLNTLTYNSLAATLSSNTVTVPAGTYLMEWDAPGYAVGKHQCNLYRSDTGSVAAAGTSEMTSSNYRTTNRSMGSAVIIVIGSVGFYLGHYTDEAFTTGLGLAVGSGTTEVFARLRIKRLQ